MIKTDNVVRACDTNDTKVKSYTATKKESFELCFFFPYIVKYALLDIVVSRTSGSTIIEKPYLFHLRRSRAVQ